MPSLQQPSEVHVLQQALEVQVGPALSMCSAVPGFQHLPQVAASQPVLYCMDLQYRLIASTARLMTVTMRLVTYAARSMTFARQAMPFKRCLMAVAGMRADAALSTCSAVPLCWYVSIHVDVWTTSKWCALPCGLAAEPAWFWPSQMAATAGARLEAQSASSSTATAPQLWPAVPACTATSSSKQPMRAAWLFFAELPCNARHMLLAQYSPTPRSSLSTSIVYCVGCELPLDICRLRSRQCMNII